MSVSFRFIGALFAVLVTALKADVLLFAGSEFYGFCAGINCGNVTENRKFAGRFYNVFINSVFVCCKNLAGTLGFGIVKSVLDFAVFTAPFHNVGCNGADIHSVFVVQKAFHKSGRAFKNGTACRL